MDTTQARERDGRQPNDGALMRVLGGVRVDPPPIWLMRQAGRYLPEYRELRAQAGSFLALCFDPALAAEVTLQPVRRFDLDAAILFADILLVPMALGVDLRFEDGEGPRLAPVRDGDGVARLLPADAVDDALASISETVRRVRSVLAPDKALIGFAGAPWTVATYMVEGGSSRDFPVVRRWAMAEPDSFQGLIDRVTAATVRYLSAQIEAGADIVQLFDSWAGALPADQLQRWCVEPVRRIVAELRIAHPRVPVIGFPRQIGAAVLDYPSATGVRAVGLDSLAEIGIVARTLPAEVAVQGNLDPLYLEIGGAAMRAAASRVLDGAAGRPHIFNLGHGVVKSTPPDHVAALVAHVRDYRAGVREHT